jgi:hypothetical protein
MIIPLVPRADGGLALALPLAVAGAGLGLLVSQLNNYTLAPMTEERVSEAAGVNSAAGSFGLSFGLAVGGAVMLAALAGAFTNMSNASEVLSPEQLQTVAQSLEEDAQVMTNTQLEAQLEGQSEDVQQEIIAINTDARHLALQIAMGIPLLAGLIGFARSFRMSRLPDIAPAADHGGLIVG